MTERNLTLPCPVCSKDVEIIPEIDGEFDGGRDNLVIELEWTQEALLHIINCFKVRG